MGRSATVTDEHDTAGEGAGTGTRRLRRDAETNRQRVLGAAGRLMAERGLAVPLDDIAAEAGVGIGTLYRRFPTRNDLIEALFEDRMAAYVADAEESLRLADGWDGLVTYLERTLARLIADRALSQILEHDPTSGRAWAVRERLGPLAERLVERAKASGRLRPDFTVGDLIVVQRMLVEVGVSTDQVQPGVWHRYLDMTLDGLAAARGGPSPLDAPALSLDQVERLQRDRKAT